MAASQNPLKRNDVVEPVGWRTRSGIGLESQDQEFAARLMSGQRQKNRPEQEVLAFPVEGRSDAPKSIEKGTETLMAKRKSESLAGTERLMEEVCDSGTI
jgi:hypothetical protein